MLSFCILFFCTLFTVILVYFHSSRSLVCYWYLLCNVVLPIAARYTIHECTLFGSLSFTILGWALGFLPDLKIALMLNFLPTILMSSLIPASKKLLCTIEFLFSDSLCLVSSFLCQDVPIEERLMNACGLHFHFQPKKYSNDLLEVIFFPSLNH